MFNKALSAVTWLLFLFFNIYRLHAQDTVHDEPKMPVRGDYRLMFYNVENLFDWYDDPLTADDDFLPARQMHWTKRRCLHKINNIYKVIVAAGEWEPPEIVAFAEIENRFVLNLLIKETPLSKFHYDIIHHNSPDGRGIDVALLYRPDRLQKISESPVTISDPDSVNIGTRDILYCTFRTKEADTIHLYINHWPSRSGGQLASEHLRMLAAKVLKSKTDSLTGVSPSSKIIIMGDFNDQPDNRSLREILQAVYPEEPLVRKKLYNLSYIKSGSSVAGTHKFQGTWAILDQVIVSGNLLNYGTLFTTKERYRIFDASFLLEPDDKYLGTKPNRTYIGYKYHGGYSDHLPVCIDLINSR